MIKGDAGKYVVVFDPLDGSSNIDASIPTGATFILVFLLCTVQFEKTFLSTEICRDSLGSGRSVEGM